MSRELKPTEIFKILSSETRYKILKLILNSKKDLCVHEISYSIGMSQSATSHQLALLENKGLLSHIRMGQTMCYKIRPTKENKDLRKIINQFK